MVAASVLSGGACIVGVAMGGIVDLTVSGTITPTRRIGGAYDIKDTQGRTWARTAARVPDAVLRLEPNAPPPFPETALAFAFDRFTRPAR